MKIMENNNPVKIPLLDKGFIRVVDTMGDDAAIVQAARVSYGEGTKTVNGDRGLIRYLMRHEHWSPFEMCEIKLHLKMPIFVARQWVRHRTASLNEISGRYSIMKDEFYIPSPSQIQAQSLNNKQGRGETLSEAQADDVVDLIQYASRAAFMDYTHLVTEGEFANDWGDPCTGYGVARELSRIVLPLNTYTEFYWKIDLNNLFHFLKLRSDPHAQYEIRVYAEAIEKMVEGWVPNAYEAWVDYQKEAVTFSRMEMDLIRAELHSLRQKLMGSPTLVPGLSKREQVELIDKLK